jgi:transposase
MGTSAYNGCTDVVFSHPILTVGCLCPSCSTANSGGRLRADTPKVVVKLHGAPLITGTRYTAEGLYCGLCGDRFPVHFPDEIKNAPKYDVSCASSLAIGRYSMGLPFYRIEKNQTMHEIPMADATQWDLTDGLYSVARPVHDMLIQYGSNGNLFQYDDTPKVIIENKVQGQPTHCTAFISVHDDKKIHLFFTGRNTAGKNVDAILKQRTSTDPIIAMMDASSSNIPKTMTIPEGMHSPKTAMDNLKSMLIVSLSMPSAVTTEVFELSKQSKYTAQVGESLAPMFILAFCLAHGRRKFFEVFKFFDKECDFVLDTIGKVYRHDAHCKSKKYTPEQRLSYHQTHSAPLMQTLFMWLNNQLVYELTEENNGLGQSVRYMLRNWEMLTTFLRVAGAPLDNNWAERAIKIVIRHRRNSLFYRTSHGAQVGDCLMSIIYTCQQNNVNAYDYLNTIQRHAVSVAANPALWLPWNYKRVLATLNELAQAA